VQSRPRSRRLSYPFESSVSPYAQKVDGHALDWACRFGLLAEQADIERFRRTKVGWLAARTSPDGSAEALSLLADWQMWLFIFDDRYCDESEAGAHPEQLIQIVTSLVQMLEGGGEPGSRSDPLSAALGDVMDRLAPMASGPQLHRFMHAVRGYFLAQFWEAGHRANGRLPGLPEYEVWRRHSGAVPTCVALIDVAGGFELKTEEYCRRDVRDITDIAVNVTSWANDVLSYEKEASRSLQMHSLPAVLAHELHLPATDAIGVAVMMHDAQVSCYLEAEESLRSSASPELRWYLDGLRNWMAGNSQWSLESGRYDQPQP
jgi:hypothetical protein